jgi:hypothetical protein
MCFVVGIFYGYFLYKAILYCSKMDENICREIEGNLLYVSG